MGIEQLYSVWRNGSSGGRSSTIQDPISLLTEKTHLLKGSLDTARISYVL